ncbi:hypothetical protein BH23CHL6_BH23CHL6_11270 [soil metagenome]
MRHPLRLFVVLVMLAVMLVGAPVQSAEAWTGKYSVYRPNSFVRQVNNYACVGASIQMMLNMILDRSDKSGENQRTYLRYARDNSRYTITNGGADPRGWALALRHFGGGDYKVGGRYSMQGSLKQAAKRMRATGKPVGLLVWRGGHAWVMTGFKATADPAKTSSFKVTGVQAMGPLWPDGTINGRLYDPGPKTWLGLSALKQKFKSYKWAPAKSWNGRWITVIP